MRCCGCKKYKTQVKSTLKRSTKSCLETDKRKELQIPKCHKCKRLVKAKKCLSGLEKILLRIQPPIADRERYLEPHHVNCFLEESKEIVIERCRGSPCNKATRRSNNTSCFEGKSKGNNQKCGCTCVDKRGRSDDEDASKSFANIKVKPGGGNVESRYKGPKSKSRKKRKAKTNRQRSTKKKQDGAKDTDSDTSIRSIDSKICLTGVSLTTEDKKTIEENRQRIHRKSKKKNKPPSNSGKNKEQADEVHDDEEEA